MAITVLELKSHIMKNTLSNFYIFVGNEIGIMNIYLEKMSNTLSLPIMRVDSVAKVYDKISVKSMFGEEEALYVIRGDMEITKNEEVYTKLKSVIGKNMIVLLYDKIDSRLKFGKFFRDDIVEFEPLSTNVLCSYIKKASKMSDRNCEKLSNIVQNSYDLSMLEVDKINRYAEVMNIKEDKSFETLLLDGTISIQQEDTVFDFVDAVMLRQKVASFEILRNLIDNGISSINILGTLYNKVKAVLLVTVCESADVENTTGLDSKEIYFCRKYINKYSATELVVMLKLIARLVSDIKSGYVDDVYATQIYLIETL